MNRIMLTASQSAVIDKIIEGHNVFLTGQAGTGKSYVLKHLLANIATQTSLRPGVTATTGAAAVLIQGQTLHSFLGIGLGKKSATELAAYVSRNRPDICACLWMLNILIIDEVSMLDHDLFQKISDYLGILRRSSKPFGGIQLVLCGDLLQLPPVDGEYCIRAPVWKEANFQVIVLKDVHRQKEDRFLDLLAKARVGNMTQDDVNVLLEHCKGTFPSDIKPTKLFALKRDVQFINELEYERAKLKTSRVETYITVYSNTKSKGWAESIGIPQMIELCIGAQVMVTMNIEQPTLINGTRGVVTQLTKDFVEIKKVDGRFDIVKMYTLRDESDMTKKVSFMPLCLAWAITHHKSQGATLDAVELDLGSSIFAYGQAYTALSRCKTMEHIRLTNISPKAFRAHPEIIQFYQDHERS